MVITDSQAFAKVSKDVPETVPLTSFSILFARYKGNLMGALRGVKALETLEDGDKVLISEGCTHHRQCNDIGTVKIPGWIRKRPQRAGIRLYQRRGIPSGSDPLPADRPLRRLYAQ